MRSFTLLLCVIAALPATLWARQAAQLGQNGRRVGQQKRPCKSEWIRRNGTVIYPGPIQVLEAQYQLCPDDKAVRSQLNEELQLFSLKLLKDNCVELDLRVAAALQVARRAAEIDPRDESARLQVEFIVELRADLRRRPKPLTQFAIPIPRAPLPGEPELP